jgi:ribonucleoside-diphosphate reductase alpha chain
MSKYFINEFQEKIWQDRYRYNNENFSGENSFCRRISQNIFKNDLERQKLLEEKIENFKIIFGGRINSNIGVSEKGLTLFNCFIKGISDKPDSIEGICENIKNYALTLKTEGGVGFCANYFRPSGTIIRKIGVTTPGSIKFIEIFDKVSEVITSGSVDPDNSFQGIPTKKSIRKGATMLTLSINHPDIEEFILAKSQSNRLMKMNLSVLVDDKFINALINNENWDLWFPDINFEKYDDEWDGDFAAWENKGYPKVIYKTIDADKLWNLLMKFSFENNEPGVLFIDNANRHNNLHYLDGGSMLSTNPCVHSLYGNVLTKNGIVEIGNIQIGDEIWSSEGWVKITNKMNRGKKKVFKYRTSGSIFYGTNNHNIMSNGKKIKIKKAKSVDNLRGNLTGQNEDFDLISIIDGLLVDKYNFFDLNIDDFIFDKTRKHLSYWKNKKEYNKNIIPINRKIPREYFHGEYNKMRSFLRGLFSANGYINTVSNKIRLISVSQYLIDDVQIMLSALGIQSYFSINNDNLRYYSYNLDIISDEDIQKFKNIIGFIQKSFSKNLENFNSINNYKDISITSSIENIEYIEEAEVIDITVDNNTHTFWCNGANICNCGEITGHTGFVKYQDKSYLLGDVCCLGSVNLVKFYDIETKIFNLKEFEECIDLVARSLDNVIDISQYPAEMYENAAKMHRKIGVSPVGIGSLLMMANIKYGSQESLEFLEPIFESYINQLYRTTAMMAKEKGPFQLYDDKIFEGGFLLNNDVLSEETISLVKKYKMRNSSLSTIPPHGTLAIFAGILSGGIEPVFQREYERFTRIEGTKQDFEYPKIHKGEWYETDYFKKSKEGKEEILISTDGKYRIDRNSGLSVLNELRDYGYNYAKKYGFENVQTARELTVEEHLNVLSLASKYVELGISKTINLPSDISFDNFKKLYQTLYNRGIKGCTTYREGTMISILRDKMKQKKIEKQQEEFLDAFKNQKDGTIMEHNVKLPEISPSMTYIIRAENKKWYVTITFKDRGCTRPFAIFVNTNSREASAPTFDALEKLSGLARERNINEEFIQKTIQASKEQKNPVKLARMLGLVLRHNIDIYSIVKVLDSVEQAHIGTFVFRIKKFLSQFSTKLKEETSRICPECKEEDSLILQEGCFVCTKCGYSKCS